MNTFKCDPDTGFANAMLDAKKKRKKMALIHLSNVFITTTVSFDCEFELLGSCCLVIEKCS